MLENFLMMMSIKIMVVITMTMTTKEIMIMMMMMTMGSVARQNRMAWGATGAMSEDHDHQQRLFLRIFFAPLPLLLPQYIDQTYLLCRLHVHVHDLLCIVVDQQHWVVTFLSGDPVRSKVVQLASFLPPSFLFLVLFVPSLPPSPPSPVRYGPF